MVACRHQRVRWARAGEIHETKRVSDGDAAAGMGQSEVLTNFAPIFRIHNFSAEAHLRLSGAVIY